MLDLFNLGRPDVLGLRISDIITDDDVRRFTEALDHARAAHGMVRLYAEVGDVRGVEVRALWTDLSYLVRNPGMVGHIGRTAVVTGAEWLRRIAEAEGKLLPLGPVRAFGPDAQAEAREWIVSEPQGVEPLTEDDLP